MAEETKEVTKPERKLIQAGFTFLPQTWEQLFSYAKEICNTDFTPKTMRGNPAMVLAAWQKGAEVGLPPMAALESICVINGVTSIHSDGYWGLIVNHPKCESFSELGPSECIEKGYGECTIKRRGAAAPVTRRFTLEMAKTAQLLGKDNWKYYPGRMLQQRARHLAADDALPEATQGLVPTEVAQDYVERDVTPAEVPLKKPLPLPAKETPDAERTVEPNQTATSVEAGGSHAVAAQAQPTGEVHQEEAQPKQTQEPTKDASAKPVEEQKTKIEVALEMIAGFTTDTFPPPNWLNPYIKGEHPIAQTQLIGAYNARKKELEL